MKINRGWFTIIELLVAILIFTIWWLSAYLLVYSAISSSIKSRNEIVAANLARQNIEIISNLRDTNWLRNLTWNRFDPSIVSFDASSWEYLTWWYYKVENIYVSDSSWNPSVKLTKLPNDFDPNPTKVIHPANSSYDTQLCLDSKNRYTYDCSASNTKTIFYSFLQVEPLKTKNSWWDQVDVNGAMLLKSIVINTWKWINTHSINTIITDWRKN